MSNLDKQAVQAVADLKAGYTLGHADVAILNELARIALASIEAEPVAYADPQTFRNFKAEAARREWMLVNPDAGLIPVYTAPPAPVSVPTFDEWLEIRGNKPLGWVKDAMRESYDACRAAMLQGANGNSPVIPDGWVACRERMPSDGEKVLTSFRGGIRTAVCKVTDVLGHKIFVDELTLFNGVPADYWQPLPAAPHQLE